MKTCIWIVLGLGLLLLAGCQRKLTEPASYTEGNVALLRTAMGGDAAAAGPAVAAAEPTGWATLRGTLTISGQAPAPATVNVTSDHSVCMPGGQPVHSQSVVVGPRGGLANVAIYLETKYPEGDAKWEHPEARAAVSGAVDFDQKNCVFLSHVFAMSTTQTMRVLNSDPVGHNTKLEGGGGARPDNFVVAAGGSAQYLPGGESSEPFGVSCNIHPWMSAYCLVRKSPYFAVTDQEGKFEIKNLPAGVPLKFRVWQERTRFIPAVTATGKIDKYSKGRLELKLDNEEERELALVLDAAILAP